jgi:ammonia channel protein AmtB
VIPELSFVAFQATFAAITCALIVGAFAERIKFSAVLLFCALWFTFSYLPIAHMVWYWDGPDAITDAKTLRPSRPPAAGCGPRARWTSRAAPWCTSTPVSPAWWAPTWSASASATARNRSRRTA